MCEIFGVSARRKILINDNLREFFRHSEEHRNGWGLAILDNNPISVEKESKKALDSEYLNSKLERSIMTSRCIGHIRMATIGEMISANTHPFSRYDKSGRRWIMAHNGTIFESDILAPYQYQQEGTTDSERIILYIIDRMNKEIEKKERSLEAKERIVLIDEIVREIVIGNKLNLMIYDGELFYVHKNEHKTLYKKESDAGVILSTRPLDNGKWVEFPHNQLIVYRDGEEVYEGLVHDSTYVYDEEQMKPLFLAYSGL